MPVEEATVDKRAVIVCLGLGVAACQPALKPDTGYPAGWPAMTVLAPGFAELAGTYANEGTATIATGGSVPVTLASLLSGCKPLAAAGAAAGGRSSVTLEIVAGGRLQPYPGLRATVAGDGTAKVCEMDSGSERNALLYQVTLDGRNAGRIGFDAGLVNVALTRGADGSLIAKIYDDQSEALMVEPTDTATNVWARFEPLSP
jgi:hypothetical protein